jgi:hypothetical protein
MLNNFIKGSDVLVINFDGKEDPIFDRIGLTAFGELSILRLILLIEE